MRAFATSLGQPENLLWYFCVLIIAWTSDPWRNGFRFRSRFWTQVADCRSEGWTKIMTQFCNEMVLQDQLLSCSRSPPLVMLSLLDWELEATFISFHSSLYPQTENHTQARKQLCLACHPTVSSYTLLLPLHVSLSCSGCSPVFCETPPETRLEWSSAGW